MAGPELAALALVALAAAAEPGGDRSPGRGAVCALRVESESVRLEPGDARTVRVRVVAPARPALRASLGQIDEPVADGPGAWVALWRAPLAGPPRVAILTALAVGDCGYTAIPVTGKGVAVVHSRPGARVVVHIGERSFGPILADPEGVALVAVEVPPGVNSVTHGKRVLPLDIPPQAHGAVAFRAEAAAADGEEAVAVMAVAVDDAGGPRTEPPALTASQGTLSGPTPAGPGAWWFTWRLTPGRAGEASLKAQLPGEPAFELRLPRPAGRPARIEVSADRGATSPDGPPVAISAILRDAAGNPVAGELSATADAGQLSPLMPDGSASHRALWTPPAHLPASGQAEIVVRAGPAEARVAVVLHPGAPAALALSAPRGTVVADGDGSVALFAEIRDAHGNSVDAPPTTTSARLGEVGEPRQVGPGRYALDYRPRRLSAHATDEVVIELPPHAARVGIHLVPPLPRLELGASAGVAIAPGGWLGLQAGAELSTWRLLLGQEAGLGAGVGFARFHREQAVSTGTGTSQFVGEVQVLALLASASWRRALGRGVSLRLDAGGGAARLESRVSVGGGPLIPEAGVVPAASAAASLGLRAWRGRAVLTARGTWMPDAHLSSLQGATSLLSLTLGYELDAL